LDRELTLKRSAVSSSAGVKGVFSDSSAAGLEAASVVWMSAMERNKMGGEGKEEDRNRGDQDANDGGCQVEHMGRVMRMKKRSGHM
jgi:hypothetical protein